MTSRRLSSACAMLAFAVAGCQQGDGVSVPVASVQEEQLRDLPAEGTRELLWGDTHLHTSASADAFENGVNNVDADTAYRFARGLPVIHPRTGQSISIDEPLDFLVIADHAEMLGIMPRLVERAPSILETVSGRKLYDSWQEDPHGAYFSTLKLGPDDPLPDTVKDLHVPEIRQTIWARQIDVAERHNQPGVFTSLIGWEWSSTPNGVNQHRVVFTSADGDVAKQFLPLSNYDTMRPEDLWQFLRETRDRTGADFVAIPHNSNLSQGQMFTMTDSDGNPISAAYSEERMEWERAVEVTQYKGTSETHPALSTSDEFAGFELRESMFDGQAVAPPSAGSFARQGLMTGLQAGARTGVNPFQFGLIGSTDSHSGLSSQREDKFYGKSGADMLAEERAANQLGAMGAWRVSAGGLTGVWADRNDRDSIFAAFRRREVYGTTGPRIAVRVFAGFHFSSEDAEAGDLAARGYAKGVPMGGELLRARAGQVPSLLIKASMAPGGANLDRVQVIKGWRDAAGELHEKIFNVAWSDGRRLRADGSLPEVGNTVDLRTARYANSIGAPELVTVWQDPEFSADESAFYYVRVLEIPTPRHQLFDALALGMDPRETGEPLTLQERAWSSPVWYRP